MTIRIRLSRVLGEERLSQKDLTELSGLNHKSVGALYNEMLERVQLDHLDKICKALDRPIGDILEYVPDEEDEKNSTR